MTPEALSKLLAPTPALYSVPAGRPFLQDLAKPLLEAYADQPDAIADLTIFLPNRRAVRSLAEIFFSEAMRRGSGAVILPRLRALGDVTEEDLLFTGTPPEEASVLLPPAELGERRLILARLVKQKYPQADWPSCLVAADDLAGLLDSFHLEDVPLEALHTLTLPETVKNAAAHWQQSLEFLEIISRIWPDLMQAYGWMEPAARQRTLMQALTRNLTEQSAGHPIIVAGSLGTVRATGQLMDAVANMPSGCVVFPGLDLGMDDGAWSKIDAPHPQALFRERLRRDFGVEDRSVVREWPCPEEDVQGAARRGFLSLALLPAKATSDWYTRFEAFRSTGQLERACDGLSIAIGQTEDEEAGFISLLIREALDQPDRTVMVVTPDRQLARRVTSKLRAWDIDVDDTGGVPVGGTYRGTYLRLVADWLDDPASPISLMAMLQHELSGFGQDRSSFQQMVRRLDKAMRGRRPAATLPGLAAFLRQQGTEREGLAELYEELAKFIDELAGLHAPFAAAETLVDRLSAHIAVAEHAASLDDMPGEARLWRYEDGEQLARILGGLLQSDSLPDMGDSEYGPLFEALLGTSVVRKRGGHPRLSIFGVMEARLQTADLVILAGLNEGTWPDAAPTDSYLSRPMRAELGLPSPEQNIGRSAHDFAQAAANPHVVLTRAARQGRDPATPSRWMTRLTSFLQKAELLEVMDQSSRLRAMAVARQRSAEVISIPAPEPRPPVSARPVDLSISDIENLLRDPYSIYSKHVLGLRALDRLDDPIAPKHKGSLFHKVLERIGEVSHASLPADLGGHARALVSEEIGLQHFPQELHILWAEDIDRFCTFVMLYEAEARAFGDPLLVEGKGRWTFDLPGGHQFTVHGRADRVDPFEDGTASIVDFKSSDKVPTTDQMAKFSPQLSVTALMLAQGAFMDTEPHPVGRLAFLNIFADREEGSVFDGKHTVGKDKIADHVSETKQQLEEHLIRYFDPQTPYLSQPRAFFTNDFGDYDHLARRGEWAGQGEGDD